MVWDWAVGGVTEEVPRTMGEECENYLTNRRRVIEAVLFSIVFICVIKWAMKRLEPIQLPDSTDKPHSGIRIALIICMTLVFGIEMGFKLANRSVIFVLNPCHIQTLVQIYILAAKPNRTTTTLFRIQMNNLNGPVLAFLFPEVECRTLPFEQGCYWIQHALLYLIPVYILRSGLYQAEDLKDYNWVIIGVELQLLYHFTVLNYFSMITGINLNHMLCAAESDPFQGEHYRIAAVIHESILCPILNKLTIYMFATPQSIQLSAKLKDNQLIRPQQQQQYEKLTLKTSLATTPSSASISSTSTSSAETTLTTLQQHKPPNKLFLHKDATTSQLIRRNVASSSSSISRDYDHKTSSAHPPQEHHLMQNDAQLEADYILEQNDMEMVDSTNLPPSPRTAEYRMPTTKID